MKLTPINWPTVIGGQKDLWRQAYARIERDAKDLSFWTMLGAHCLWSIGIPARLILECHAVARYLSVDPSYVMAAQVVYDEGWNGASLPGHGCTSVSSPAGFGRNMDYAYPENAADFIYHKEIQVGEKTLVVEGFVGLLGWLAYRGETSAASFNQAPSLRSIRRTKMPALAWFRERSLELEAAHPDEIPDEGDIWSHSTASDFLLHFVKGDRRFIGEYFDGQLVWQRQTGKAAQANIYQILDLEVECPEWQEDSETRMEDALRARGIRASLRAAANEYTADQIVLIGKGAI